MKALRRAFAVALLVGPLGVLVTSGGCDGGGTVQDGGQVQDPPPIAETDPMSGAAARQQQPAADAEK